MKHHEWLWVLLASLAVAMTYASFSWWVPVGRYNTPDEVTQSFFAQRLAQGESLRVPDYLNSLAGQPIVRPRWVHIQDNAIVPAGFLGFPVLVGELGRVLGVSSLPYVTPLLAVVGLMCFYFWLRDVWGRGAAIIGFIMLMFLPAYAYYHARGFFHNALFFDLVLLSGLALHRSLRSGKLIYYLLTGLAAGLSLAIRSSEIYWLTGAGLVWLIIEREAVKWKYVWLIGLGVSLGLLPVLLANFYTYGQVLAVGYGAITAWPSDNLGSSLGFLTKYLMPFGVHPRTIVKIFVDYMVKFSWWWFGLALGGFFYMIWKWKTFIKSQKAFWLMVCLTFIWLTIMYGSWQFSDNPNPDAVTIGNSYVRYFLPAYALLLSGAAVALAWLWDKRWGGKLVGTILLLYIFFSVRIVIGGEGEGLAQLSKNLWKFEKLNRAVQSITPAGSVVVANERNDKFFWPDRQVIAVKLGESEYRAISRLVKNNIKVYSFQRTYSAIDLGKLNQQLNQWGLYLEIIPYNLGEYSLYDFKFL